MTAAVSPLFPVTPDKPVTLDELPPEITATRDYASSDDAGLFAPAYRSAPAPLLSAAQLAGLNSRIGFRADALIEAHIKKATAKKPKESAAAAPAKTNNRGRPPKVLVNKFVGHLGCTTCYGRYPYFAMDIIEGIARLEWHSHGLEQTNKPLSVRRMLLILEVLEEVTTATVGELLGIATRHSQRYVKGIELALPRLMKCRPQHLIDEMEGNLPAGVSEWQDTDLAPPCPESLAKLHQDIGLDAIELTPHVYGD